MGCFSSKDSGKGKVEPENKWSCKVHKNFGISNICMNIKCDKNILVCLEC